MHVALWKWNRNVLGSQCPIDSNIQVVDDDPTAFNRRNAAAQCEIEAVIPEFFESNDRWRLLQQRAVGRNSINDYFLNELRVGAIGDPKFQGDSVNDAGKGPIEQFSRNQILVWNDQFFVARI